MAVKPPRNGGTHVDVDVQINPNRPGDRNLPGLDVPSRVDFDPLGSVGNPKPRAELPGNTDLDAILPAPAVMVHPIPSPIEPHPFAGQPLENYWIKAPAKLPDADSEGVRVYKKRQYVDVPGGAIALIGVDPDTGLYRARLPSELRPSGPVLLRDIDSGVWHPLNDVEAGPVPLTGASLQAFRTELDFSDVEPDGDGLFHHDDKLYVVINKHAYQAMRDLDASTPTHKVWRIVNAKDPVATDSANIYRAHRSGETRAITLDEQNTWASISTGLRGGMRRNEPAQANMANLHRPWVTVIATRTLVKSYFPEATNQHADDFISRFGSKDEAEVELKRLQREYPQLNREVSAWEAAYKGNDNEERNRRLAIGARIRRLYKWQGEASEKVYRDGRLLGFKLELDLTGRANLKLPVFSIRLNSVVSIRLEGNAVKDLGSLFSMFSHIEILETRNLGRNGNALLAVIDRLTELRVLEIHQATLWLLPPNVTHFTRLSRLQELSLISCSLSPPLSVRGMTELRVLRVRSSDLTVLPAGLTALPRPSRLEVLDLHHNPSLRVAPDFTSMSGLRELDLSYTGIRQMPVGIGAGGGPAQLEILRLERVALSSPPSLRGMTGLRELDLTSTGIAWLPEELGTQNGPLGLQILKLGRNPLFLAPSLRGMTTLREVDLSYTKIDKFPEGVTTEIPTTSLNLLGNKIASIPETIELRNGFDLRYNPISDSASLRRLIAARRQMGADIWLRWGYLDDSVEPWMQNVPQALRAERLQLWDSLAKDRIHFIITWEVRRLRGTPEFQVEYQLLQRRLWSLLEHYAKADPVEQGKLRAIAYEISPGKMLEKLEEEIRKLDPGRQNQPPHHLPKRPRFD
jgi:Leucine-rich repeat (LRR) protein